MNMPSQRRRILFQFFTIINFYQAFIAPYDVSAWRCAERWEEKTFCTTLCRVVTFVPWSTLNKLNCASYVPSHKFLRWHLNALIETGFLFTNLSILLLELNAQFQAKRWTENSLRHNERDFFVDIFSLSLNFHALFSWNFFNLNHFKVLYNVVTWKCRNFCLFLCCQWKAMKFEQPASENVVKSST